MLNKKKKIYIYIILFILLIITLIIVLIINFNKKNIIESYEQKKSLIIPDIYNTILFTKIKIPKYYYKKHKINIGKKFKQIEQNLEREIIFYLTVLDNEETWSFTNDINKALSFRIDKEKNIYYYKKDKETNIFNDTLLYTKEMITKTEYNLKPLFLDNNNLYYVENNTNMYIIKDANPSPNSENAYDFKLININIES
jgi:hypothetical protein